AIIVDALNTNFGSVDGVLFNKSLTELIQCPGGKAGSYGVPDGVTEISPEAFRGCTNLEGVTIPNSVTSIGNWSFFECMKLNGVYFEGNAPLVEWYTFVGCDQAVVYYLPGTDGWAATFEDRPAAPWLPKLQAMAPRSGVPPNPFALTISWARDK